ncbi:MAG: hypothetical protein KBH15_05430 [Candidatus Atribacteria bacterium]|nr:hypothetical protein [Candidatus Atribacteria bacterium]
MRDNIQKREFQRYKEFAARLLLLRKKKSSASKVLEETADIIIREVDKYDTGKKQPDSII